MATARKKSWTVAELFTKRKRFVFLSAVFAGILIFFLFQCDVLKTGPILRPRDPRLSCCQHLPKKPLAELCGWSDFSASSTCSCEDFMYCHLVVVSAVSSNHFKEFKSLIGSVQTYLPDVKLLLYDLGLSESDRAAAASYCSVEIRKFDFEAYPPHVRDLYTYAWKPAILAEVARGHELILYGDASVRITGPYIFDAFSNLRRFPFLAGRRQKLPFMSFVHEGMLRYMKYPLSRKKLYNVGGIEANLIMLWVNSVTTKRIVEPLLDCALHKDCIAPEGAVLHGCAFYYPFVHSHWYRDGSYVGSHLYDQSALNLIVMREFGVAGITSYLNQTLNDALWKVDRTEKKFNRHIYFDPRSC